MVTIVEEKFRDWTSGKDTVAARRNIYRKIRDIPYAIIPGQISSARYHEILRLGKGSCTPKHLLLACMYQELGIMVLCSVYPFRWADLEIDYPPSLRRRTEVLPDSHHLSCRAEIDGRLVLIDATIDLPLKALGLPVNEHWDGESDTVLPFEPVGEEQLYHPLEADSIQVSADEAHLVFYDELNKWLEKVRAERSER